MTFWLDLALALGVLLPPPLAAWLHVRHRRLRADPYRVASLEYELGLTDERPSSHLWSGEPGAVIFYRPTKQHPGPMWRDHYVRASGRAGHSVACLCPTCRPDVRVLQ